MIEKLKQLIEKILIALGLKKVSAPKEEESPPIANPVPETPVEEVVEEKADDPESSNPNANIGSFLWKPASDNDGRVVIVVACDEVRNSDLKCRILNKAGKVLDTLSGSPTGRANQLPGYKFGRIHFRSAKTAKQYNRSAPLTVEFFIQKRREQIIAVLGKPSIKVKAPLERKDVR